MKPREGKTIIISFHGDIPLANRTALVHREPSFLLASELRFEIEYDTIMRIVVRMILIETIENLIAIEY